MHQPDNELIALRVAIQLGLLRPDHLAKASGLADDPEHGIMDRLEARGVLTRRQREWIEVTASGVIAIHGGRLDVALARLSAEATMPVPSDRIAAAALSESTKKFPVPDAAVVSDDTAKIPIPEGHQSPEAGESEFTEESRGRYDLKGEIGRGGQARVILAFDRHVGRDVAWKECLPDSEMDSPVSTGSGVLQPKAMRFLREARITGRLEHPNIVPVHEVGRRQDGTLYYTMRLVHGETLRMKLKACEGLPDRMKLLGHFWDTCNAVAFAHKNGVMHRDLKPSNIMVGEFGETVVLDWGLAKVRGTDDSKIPEIARLTQAHRNANDTIDGSAVGTPSYMSPEQARGRVDDIDERTDVWALGVILYEILTGQAPFWGGSPAAIIASVLNDTAPPVLEVCPAAPTELAAIAGKALKKVRDDRYPSGREMAADVAAYMTGQRVQAHEYTSWELLKRFAKRNRPALAAAVLVFGVVLTALVVVGIAYSQEHKEQLRAHLHLAQAYARQAERLAEQRDQLNARVFAAASLLSNPAFPGSPFYEPSFSTHQPDSDWFRLGAVRLLNDAKHTPLEGLRYTFRAQEAVSHAAVAPDGSMVAAGDFAGMIYIWRLADGLELRRFQAHSYRMFGLVFSPDSKRLVSSAGDRSLQVWDVESGEPVLSLTNLDQSASGLAYSPDGKELAIGDQGGSVHVIDASTGRLTARFPSHASQVDAVAYSPDGRWFASGSWDQTVHIVDRSDYALKHSLAGHSDSVVSVAFSPDSRTLATGSYDKTARLWDVEKGRWIATLEGSRDAIYSVAFSPDGRRVLTGSQDRTFRISDSGRGKLLITHEGHGDSVLTCLFSHDGKHIVTASFDRTVRVWKWSNEDGLGHLEHSGTTTRTAYSADGRLLATSASDPSVRVWDANTGALKQTLGHTDIALGIAFSRDGKRLGSGGFDNTVRTWNLETGTQEREMKGHEAGIISVEFAPDGKMLASGARDRTARLWDVTTGTPLAVLGGHGDWVWATAFSPDGSLLVTASGDHLVRIWNVSTRSVTALLEGHKDWATSAVFSPDGRYLFTSGKDRVAIQWDVATKREVRRFVGHRQWVNEVKVSADGSMIATAGDDGLAVVWDVGTGRAFLHLGGLGGVNSVALRPDRKRIAVTTGTSIIQYPVEAPAVQGGAEALLEAEAAAGTRLTNSELEVTPGQ